MKHKDLYKDLSNIKSVRCKNGEWYWVFKDDTEEPINYDPNLVHDWHEINPERIPHWQTIAKDKEKINEDED